MLPTLTNRICKSSMVVLLGLWLARPEMAIALEAQATIDIGVDEHVGSQLPLDITFTTDNGDVVPLGTFFDATRPVILVPVFYNCPRICGYILEGVQGVLQSVSRHWMGRDFQIVTFSIGPEDAQDILVAKAQRARKKVGRGTHDANSWHFVRGTQSSIARLTAALGYRYTKDGEDYAHPAVIVVTTGEGKITRYLYGLTFPSQDVELALSEARSGTINDTVTDKILLYCYKYDPVAQEYVLAARNFMQVGGYVTLVVVVGFLASLWVTDRRKRNIS